MTAFILHDIPTYCDTRGSLSVVDKLLPFEVARTYWIYGADGQTRGGHRHVVTRQAFVAISGIIEVLIDDGYSSETIELNTPQKYLLVEPNFWHTMKFNIGSILLVMASHNYDEADYIEAPYCQC